MSGAVTGSHRLLPFGAVAALALIGAATSAGAGSGRLERPSAIATTGCAPGSIHRLRSSRLAYAAVARSRVVARGAPHGRFVASFGRLNVNGVRTVFGIVSATMDGSCRATWYRVQLPVRPNGTTGWVRARDVAVQTITTRILVDLSQHRVTLYQSGRPILVAPAVIGSGSTPTPTGHYYVNQRLLTRNAFGAYGPGAVGISAFSPALQSWAQGGPIAIHGTNAPDMIGFSVSHGCVRVRNPDARRCCDSLSKGPLWRLGCDHDGIDEDQAP